MQVLSRTFVVGLVAAAAFVTPATAENPANDPPIPLPPVQVGDASLFFGFSILILADKTTDEIRSATFAKIERGSLAEKAGLRVADRLVAIDGRPMLGMKLADYHKLIGRTFNPGDRVTYSFTIERGLEKPRRTTIALTTHG